MNNTADGTLLTVYEAGTSNIIETSGGPFLASEKLANLYKAYLTSLRKAPAKRVGAIAHNFLLKDSAYIDVVFMPSATCSVDVNRTIFPGETQLTNVSNACGYIAFDINDNEPPNVNGKDMFILPLHEHG